MVLFLGDLFTVATQSVKLSDSKLNHLSGSCSQVVLRFEKSPDLVFFASWKRMGAPTTVTTSGLDQIPTFCPT